MAMFQNEECDASVGDVASSFILNGMLNSNVADVVLYALREKYRGTDKLIVPRWAMTKILNGDLDGNVWQWFTRSGVDGHDFVYCPTFDPPPKVPGMKPGKDVGHLCLALLNMKFCRFECLDSLRDESRGDVVRFFRRMTDNIKRLWREASVDRAKPFSPMHIDDFSCEFVRVPQQQNTHDCCFFMTKLQVLTLPGRWCE